MQKKIGAIAILVAIVLVAGIVPIGIFGWWLPYRANEQRIKNEGSVFATLKAVASIEAVFRSFDQDGNGVKDYRTGDLAGLLRFGLIERSLAEADSRPLSPLVPTSLPMDGYYFMALEMDDSETPPEAYGQDTDRKSGEVHHLKKFGFLAYPAEPGRTGRFMFMINENNTVFRAELTAPRPRNWPSSKELMKYWSKPS